MKILTKILHNDYFRTCESIYEASKYLQTVLRDFIEMADSSENR